MDAALRTFGSENGLEAGQTRRPRRMAYSRIRRGWSVLSGNAEDAKHGGGTLGRPRAVKG